jgi:serine/threonine-protein kinase RsbW
VTDDRTETEAELDRGQGPRENVVSLRIESGPLVAPTLCRVVSMVLVRADCPLDRLDDAMLICDAIAANASAQLRDGQLRCTISTDGEGASLRVGGLVDEGARRLLAESVVPGVGNVLERMSDEISIEPAETGGSEDLLMGLRFG